MGNKIYHYCNYETFKCILQNNSLRLSDITKSNDNMELNYYSSFLIGLSKSCEDFFANKERFEEITDSLSEYFEQWKCYATCFSMRDMLTSWERYGDKTKGISIGFDKDVIMSMDEVSRVEDIFDKDISMKTKRPTILNYINESESDLDAKYLDDCKLIFGKVSYKRPFGEGLLAIPEIVNGRAGVKKYIIYESAFVKHLGFRDEREERLAFITTKKDAMRNIAKLGKLANNICEDSFDFIFPKNAVKEIYIGPNSELSKNDIEEFLHENGYTGVKVIKSDIPYKLR